MKKIVLFTICILLFSFLFSQQINGVVYHNEDNFKIIKVWGTHEERGYATGYLLAAETEDLYINYLLPQFGSYYQTARDILATDVHLKIDSVYIYEAMAMAEGLTDSGEFEDELDYIDVLLANCFLDFQNFVGKGLGLENGCSSLISWGAATEGTELGGKSVMSRHLDWSAHPAVLRTQVIVIHFPTEGGEQPWLLIGFAGQMSVLSGVNASGVGVMQHMLSDVSAGAVTFSSYEPIWFSLRKALEINDYNSDGVNNCLDINAVINENTHGYADSYIITGVAPSTNTDNEKIATIIEVAPSVPYITIRNTEYEDGIPGDNLYAANSSIARNDALNYCIRYNSVKSHMGDGTLIGKHENWSIMNDYSSSCAFSYTGNIQFMQFAPEQNYLKLSRHTTTGVQACENTPVEYSLNQLFEWPVEIKKQKSESKIDIYPNPAKDKISIIVPENTLGDILSVYSANGLLIYKNELTSKEHTIDISKLEAGIYFIKLQSTGQKAKFIVD
ncbi:MAG TPA: T9SS type A sorting domain-containing protein [Bacteroidales bacterium]|nr:T9SS type A sorting domain-containing protein [Bacteroidales bacterium]